MMMLSSKSLYIYIVENYADESFILSKITLAVKEGKKKFSFIMCLNQFDFIDYYKFCK